MENDAHVVGLDAPIAKPEIDMDIKIASLRAKVSEQEWQARVDLAACYRLVSLFGWDDLVFTHISLRLPGPKHHFLINPYGMRVSAHSGRFASGCRWARTGAF